MHAADLRLVLLRVLLVAISAVFTTCADAPVAPEPEENQVPAPLGESAGSRGRDGCPIAADFVVGDEVELTAALAAAAPGDVIGLDGFFEVTEYVLISTDGITLTCASPGSGLYGGPFPRPEFGFDNWYLLDVFDPSDNIVNNVIVDQLRLDGSAARAPYSPFGAIGARLSNSHVVCGTWNCVFVHESTDTEIVDNVFVASDPNIVSGVHFQFENLGYIPDGLDITAHVSGNTITTTVPNTLTFVGAIRFFSTTGRILKNEIRGPWQNGVAISRADGIVVKYNEIDGATLNGIRLARATNGTIKGNEVKNSGEVGIRAYFFGDDLASTDNTITDNEIMTSGLESCRDDNSGSGTAGTANTWRKNEADATSSPPGICGNDE